MAKDGTMRGGQRVGSGRKSKALTEKIDSGLAATVIDLPEPAEFDGEDVPPVKDFLKAAQKSGIDLCAEDAGYMVQIKAGDTVKKQIESTAPKKTGKYSKSWAVKKTRETSDSIQVVVHSKRYQLTHLLEFGHAKRGGGRTRAFQWGADFIGGIVNGIKSMIGKVGDAVSSVADKIKSFLYFSVPDEGPLTDYESWMPDFIGGLAKGIEKSRGMIEQAMQGVTGDMTITPRVMAAQGGYSGVGVSNGDLLSGINTALTSALAGGGSAGDIVIPVYIGGDMIDEIVVTAQQRMNLRSGGR